MTHHRRDGGQSAVNVLLVVFLVLAVLILIGAIPVNR